MMKGVILAGGTGTRLRPCTEVTNKHLLPVYDWPMLFYPINTLLGAGVTEICIVLGGNSIGDIVSLCGDGSRFGVNLTYKHQKQEGGIAEALLLTKSFVGDDDVAVILGDNIFLDQVELQYLDCPSIIVTHHKRPKDYGCLASYEIVGTKLLAGKIIEKPQTPTTDLIVTGLYLYSGIGLYDLILRLRYSDRGELEITDLNNLFPHLGMDVIPDNSWYDAGSVESIQEASKAVRKYKKNGSYKVFFPKEF